MVEIEGVCVELTQGRQAMSAMNHQD